MALRVRRREGVSSGRLDNWLIGEKKGGGWLRNGNKVPWLDRSVINTVEQQEVTISVQNKKQY